MRNRFDAQLKQLNDDIIDMGTVVQRSISCAVRALLTQDKDQAREAVENGELASQKERSIESLCLKLLMQQQPVARDLRMISSALKMITDMERISVQAADIADLAIYVNSDSVIKKAHHIEKMAKETLIMIMNALDAYVEKDIVKAQSVIAHDDIVDELFLKTKKEIIQQIQQGGDDAEQIADLLMAAKYFERIGDHAANIAEWVYFSITGQHKLEKMA